MCRVGQNHTFIGIYGVFTVLLAGKLPYIRSYTVCIYTVLANPSHVRWYVICGGFLCVICGGNGR